MKTKKWIKASMLSMMAILLAACASEDIAQDKKKENETEAPKGGVIFATNDTKISAKRRFIDEDEFAGAKTRTDIKHTPGQGAEAYWTSDDFIWVKDKNGTWQKSTAITLHDGGASAEFTLPGSKADYADGCEVHYTGTSVTLFGAYISPLSVGMYAKQSRTTANDFSKAGEWGDCGSGRARNTGNPDKFNFTLSHKSAYLCFLPRCENATLSANIRLESINITAANEDRFADLCYFDGENLTTPGSPFNWDYIHVDLPDFKLETEANQALNATYIVVRPGTYDFTIEYTIKDPTTNVETVITDTKTNITLDKGNIYDVTADLSPAMPKYCMWDAKYDYWYNHLKADGTPDGNYPQNNSDPRWYREGSHIRIDATKSCKDCPNVNEMCWYVFNGDPHWGTSIVALDGHLQQMNGIWLKKKAKIMADEGITEEQMKNGYPKISPTDYRMLQFGWGSVTPNSAPIPPNDANYFFLPALGRYYYGSLENLGSKGGYWTSSASAGLGELSYYLDFKSDAINIYFNNRNIGFSVVAFE